MRLKRAREGLTYVDEPSHQWVADQLARYKTLKRIVPSPLEADRTDACSKGRIKAWFDHILKQVDPRQ